MWLVGPRREMSNLLFGWRKVRKGRRGGRKNSRNPLHFQLSIPSYQTTKKIIVNPRYRSHSPSFKLVTSFLLAVLSTKRNLEQSLDSLRMKVKCYLFFLPSTCRHKLHLHLIRLCKTRVLLWQRPSEKKKKKGYICSQIPKDRQLTRISLTIAVGLGPSQLSLLNCVSVCPVWAFAVL